MSNRPFDLTKLDFESRRKEKRRRLLLISLPGVLLLLFAGIGLIVPTILTNVSAGEFTKGNYSAAASNLAPLRFLNVIEPYKAHYNYGTALSGEGKFDEAMNELEAAIAYTNDQKVICVITYNLVLTMEGAGDQKLKTADLTSAITLYARAINRIKDNADCFKDSALQQRIEEKLKATEEVRAKQGNNGTAEDQTQNTPDTDQRAKLEDIEEEAIKERNELESRNEEYVTPDPKVKPW